MSSSSGSRAPGFLLIRASVAQPARKALYLPILMSAVATPSLRASSSAVVREVAWRILVGLAAGALAGLAVGGVGGRLAMLLLRLTSPDSAIGLTSDDGFEIGVFSHRTLLLLRNTAAFGALLGAVYAVVRLALPPRLRVVL